MSDRLRKTSENRAAKQPKPKSDLDILLGRCVPEPNTGCWLWTGCDTGSNKVPYGSIKLRGKSYRAHRLSWEIHNGCEVPDGLAVCHKCDTPKRINPDHLFIGTIADNNRDRDIKGRARQVNGERQWLAKLTSANVVQMREDRANGETLRTLSTKYSVSENVVSKICKGTSWRAESGPVGVKHKNSVRYNRTQRLEIVRMAQLGKSKVQIAKDLGMSRSTVTKIVLESKRG